MERSPQVSLKDLAHVGHGTAAGDWLRRYWLVVARSEELKDIPQGLKVLNEDLVLFRDRAGRVGLLGSHCPHRGASLEYGDIEERGIRCPYHGWLFDVRGRCLEQPAEPEGSLYHEKVRQLSYAVREFGGLIFAYMGPAQDRPPPLPKYSTLLDDGAQKEIEPPRYYDYQWFNFFENSADPAHFFILHMHTHHPAHIMPFEPVETSYGMKTVWKKPGPTPDTEYVNEWSLALPSIIQTGYEDLEVFVRPPPEGNPDFHSLHFEQHILFLTPNDDEHFMIFKVNTYNGPVPDFFSKRRARRGARVQTETAREYDHRKHVPFRGNVRLEDIVTQGTQGFIGYREEHLGSSDRGVILLRKVVMQAIETVRQRGRPKGVSSEDEAQEVIRFDSYTGIRAKA